MLSAHHAVPARLQLCTAVLGSRQTASSRQGHRASRRNSTPAQGRAERAWNPCQTRGGDKRIGSPGERSVPGGQALVDQGAHTTTTATTTQEVGERTPSPAPCSVGPETLEGAEQQVLEPERSHGEDTKQLFAPRCRAAHCPLAVGGVWSRCAALHAPPPPPPKDRGRTTTTTSSSMPEQALLLPKTPNLTTT